MASLALTIRETLRYRGAVGQWSWVLHRVTGLGVLLFLFLHVIDTSWAVFYPELYVEAIAVYQSPLFTLGEFALVFCVVYHAFNGLRIIFFDFQPHLWRYQQRAVWIVLGATVLLLVPVFIAMFGHVLEHYETATFDLQLGQLIRSQLPFVAGIVIGIIVAMILSGVVGLIQGDQSQKRMERGGGLERFWWSFMRISGILIVPLVFGHLAMMHIIQGVFDITAAGMVTVGTDLVNESGTAVEFAANRWNFLLGGVAIWKIYDVLLLGLVVIHGFNGFRYVLTDYTMERPLLRRAAVILCTIGAIVLLVIGAAALLSTITQDSIDLAIEATRHLQEGG